jgi:hypothetical protein
MKQTDKLHAIKEAAGAIYKMTHLSAEQRAYLLIKIRE